MVGASRPCFTSALQRLDLLLHREILRLRAYYQLSLDEFRGLYVSDQHVDTLVAESMPKDKSVPGVAALTDQADAMAQISRRQLAEDPLWAHLAGGFRLTVMEQDLLLLAMAPEFHSKYDMLFAYLNNDVTRKYPTIDLALRLFADGGGWTVCRAALGLTGRLFAEHLMQWRADAPEPGGRLAAFAPTPSVRSYLLGLPPADPIVLDRSQYHPPTAAAWDHLVFPDELDRRLKGLAQALRRPAQSCMVVMAGEIGSGRQPAAGAVLSAAGKAMIRADLTTLATDHHPLLSQVQRLVVQARLANAGLFLVGLDAAMAMGAASRDRRELGIALRHLAETPVAVFFPVPPDLPWRPVLADTTAVCLLFPEPTAGQRKRLWQRALSRHQLHPHADDVTQVVDHFLLNSGQIEAAAASLRRQRQLTSDAQEPIQRSHLFTAAKEQSMGDIGNLARKVRLLYLWQDLVLPAVTLQHIQQITTAIRSRAVVYYDWGMQRRMGGASGLMLLFEGASGTGKTMSASVIARELGLDLYRIDLAGVVSKYIGETEKNLERIFSAAHRANCILFFDEADALFGKRTEVKDAHDRYANIEVAYLLQKMEEHDGVVILATNIARNMDQAFTRRMHYAVEFPRPNVAQRERLWRGMFSDKTPLAPDVDFSFLARQFDTTGGDIKTAALDAAMLAAGNGRMVTMTCLVKAMARQVIKQGQVPSTATFKHYYRMLND